MTHYKLPNGTALCGSEMAEDFVASPSASACNKCMRIYMLAIRQQGIMGCTPLERNTALNSREQVNASLTK